MDPVKPVYKIFWTVSIDDISIGIAERNYQCKSLVELSEIPD